MANRPSAKPRARTRVPAATPIAPAKTPAGKARPLETAAELRRLLAAAQTRIAAMEKTNRELSRRIELAIATLHKLLDN